MKIRKNGKTITLSESDMRRITKIVMKEQMENDDCLKNLQSKVKDLPPSCLASDTQMLCYTELLQKNTSAAKEFAECVGLDITKTIEDIFKGGNSGCIPNVGKSGEIIIPGGCFPKL
jgi:hypothetical protein